MHLIVSFLAIIFVVLPYGRRSVATDLIAARRRSVATDLIGGLWCSVTFHLITTLMLGDPPPNHQS